MNKEERKQYAQLDREISVLTNKMDTIVARHRKSIWMDSTFDCDRKDILRNAELTLRLADDKEYQSMLEQLWDKETKQKELGDLFEL